MQHVERGDKGSFKAAYRTLITSLSPWRAAWRALWFRLGCRLRVPIKHEGEVNDCFVDGLDFVDELAEEDT